MLRLVPSGGGRKRLPCRLLVFAHEVYELLNEQLVPCRYSFRATLSRLRRLRVAQPVEARNARARTAEEKRLYSLDNAPLKANVPKNLGVLP